MAQRSERPHLALLDHRLPDHDVEWLGLELRARDPSGHCCLVSLSSLSRRLGRRATGAFDRSITKPVKQDALYRVLVDCSGTALHHVEPAHAAAPELLGLQVLLVDDNAVNQKVGERQLTRLGMTVTSAWNGEEAIAHLKRTRFDIVLMDCQMPVMDGYEATRILRNPQTGGLNAAIPVIAMTAHAMAGDRERCFAAGMDDYLTKPIDPERLVSVLTHTVTRASACAPPDTLPPVLDLPALRRMCGDDREFLTELLMTFRQSAATLIVGAQALAGPADATRLKQLMHQLRGASSNVYAKRLAQHAAGVEALVEQGMTVTLVGLTQSWVATERELEEALATLVKQSTDGNDQIRQTTGFA